MKKKTIAVLFQIKNSLDDDYTLFDDGSVLHNYDQNIYHGGFNKEELLHVKDLSNEIKEKLLEASEDDNKEIVRKILGL